MLKRDYFILAMNSEAYRWKAWTIEAFALTNLAGKDRSAKVDPWTDPIGAKHQGGYPCALFADDQTVWFHHPESGERIVIDDLKPMTKPFDFMDELEVTAEQVPNLQEDVVTTYGNLLFNFNVLIYAFGAVMPYINAPVNVRKIEAELERRLYEEGETPPAGGVTVEQYKRFAEAMLYMAGLTQLCVPAATPKALTINPAIIKRRDELLEEHKDRLHDPAVISEIENELIAMDRADMADDESMGFLIDNKSFDIVRKKTLIMHGAESAFQDGNNVQMIPTSLDEGLDPDFMPEYANSLREGSYARGTLTALGGSKVKETYRVAQNVSVQDEDCGVKFGIPTLIPKGKEKYYIGNYYFENGKQGQVSEENVADLQTRAIEIRSPIYCHAEGSNYCRFCVGDALASAPEAIPTLLADVGSAMMGRFMALMHGKKLSTAKYDFKTAIS